MSREDQNESLSECLRPNEKYSFSESGGLIDIENPRVRTTNVSGDKLVYLHKQAVPGRSGTGNGLFLLVRN
jgi:hypothetical protein